MRKFLLAACLCLPLLAQASADELLIKLRRDYPSTRFDSVKESVVKGVFEVKMGKNIAYVEPSGRYWFFGALFDMPNQKDLTAEAAETSGIVEAAPASADAPAVKTGKNFTQKTWPVEDALVRTKGEGKRKIYLFSDAECPYCRSLEKTLAKVDNVTIYTFVTPLLGRNEINRAIWCAQDKRKAWEDWMIGRQSPASAECVNPLERNVSLAISKGARGVPFMINEGGASLAGAQSLETINAWLDR